MYMPSVTQFWAGLVPLPVRLVQCSPTPSAHSLPPPGRIPTRSDLEQRERAWEPSSPRLSLPTHPPRDPVMHGLSMSYRTSTGLHPRSAGAQIHKTNMTAQISHDAAISPPSVPSGTQAAPTRSFLSPFPHRDAVHRHALQGIVATSQDRRRLRY
ncbi:hypothetical protein B0T14DRAFT_200026 [Immersiella caudata]|uniref:Uncharacterized protein n=1 Tax=Immersiella caudata TaxID=314043 RepID=A0AA39WP94_9PEZI|nr:hypothetical protein B0T14DRAFT_200026 [Immersiella caudata]